MKCINCNNELNEGVKFCNKCGTPVNEVKNEVTNNVAVEKTEKKNNPFIYIIVGLICFLIGAGAGYWFGRNISAKKPLEEPKTEELNKDENGNNESTTPSSEYIRNPIDVNNLVVTPEDDIAKKIEVIDKMYLEKNHYLRLLVKNNNDFPVEISGYLNIMNDQNQRVDRNYDTEYVEAGKMTVIDFTYLTKEEHSSVQVSYKAKKPLSNYTFLNIKPEEIKTTDDDGSIRLDYSNNTSKDVSISVTGIYYKNDKIVGYDNTHFTNVKAGLTDNAKIRYYNLFDYKMSNGNGYKDVMDRYEVIVSSAYHYDKNY